MSGLSSGFLGHLAKTLAIGSPDRRGERWLLREVVRRLHSKLGDDADNPHYIFTVTRRVPVGIRRGDGIVPRY